MEEYIRFPYQTKRKNYLDETFYVIEEMRVPVSRIHHLREEIDRQALDLEIDGRGDNYCCLINEIDLEAMKIYIKNNYQLYESRGFSKLQYYTQAGLVEFYIANVSEPIVGYR